MSNLKRWLELARQNRFLRGVGSVKVSTLSLLALFFLTFFGTLHQVEKGLLAAQERYFYSLFFLAWGWIPLPGARLVLSILGISLTTYTVLFIKYSWKRVGFVMLHWSVVFFLFSFFLSFYFSKEGKMTLPEGSESLLMRHPYKWNLAIYKEGSMFPDEKVPISTLKNEQDIEMLGVKSHINKVEPNSRVLYLPESAKILSTSGMNTFLVDRTKREPGQFTPALEMALDGETYMLWGGDESALTLKDKHIFIRLQPEEMVLPIGIKLLDVKEEKYDNTPIAKNYSSDVEVFGNNIATRKVAILMNQPFRYEGYTVFQSGYYVDPTTEKEYSTFQITYNPFYQLPYWLTLFLLMGGIIHFSISLREHLRKKSKEASNE